MLVFAVTFDEARDAYVEHVRVDVPAPLSAPTATVVTAYVQMMVAEKVISPVYGGSLERMAHVGERTHAYRPQRSWKEYHREQCWSMRS